MKKEHYSYLRQLTKIRDCAIDIRSRADVLYCDFTRKTDKEKDDFLDDIERVENSLTDIDDKIGTIYDAYASIIDLSYPLHTAPVTIYAPVREDSRGDCVGAMPKSWAERNAQMRVNEFYGEDLSMLWNAIQLIDWPHLCDEYKHLDEEKKELYILKPYCKATEILVGAGWTDEEIVVART
ncbi:MAG: hypothetical protein LUD72_05320 [Bacteroidales bacterium]|nr:hypothetical protein [Bacteroidales bacterium]